MEALILMESWLLVLLLFEIPFIGTFGNVDSYKQKAGGNSSLSNGIF